MIKLTPAPAPKKRVDDTWRSYIPGVVIAVSAILAHHFLSLPEHYMGGAFFLAGKVMPRGRIRDALRWQLAKNTRTDEQRIAREEDRRE